MAMNISEWESIAVDNIEFSSAFVVEAVMFELGYFTLSSVEVSILLKFFYLSVNPTTLIRSMS